MGLIMRDIIFNGESLNQKGFAVVDYPSYKIAEPDLEFVAIPARNGEAAVTSKRYKNVEEIININAIPHMVFEVGSSRDLAMALTDWLSFDDGKYREYRDTARPGYFTKAICTSLGDMTTCGFIKTLETALTFNRLPYWYSDIGQQEITFANPIVNKEYTIYNPEHFSSCPVWEISKTGLGKAQILLNGLTIKLSLEQKAVSKIKIDSATGAVYDNNGNLAAYDNAKFDYLPIFKSGENTLKITNTEGNVNLTEIRVKPNWRRL